MNKFKNDSTKRNYFIQNYNYNITTSYIRYVQILLQIKIFIRISHKTFFLIAWFKEPVLTKVGILTNFIFS